MNKYGLAILCMVLGVFAVARTATAAPQIHIDRLYGMIEQRLSYMEDVAAWKWLNDKSIEDKEREVVVLQNAQQAARQFGLDGPSTNAFFIAQMEAAKFFQQQFFDQWHADGFRGGTPPDLQNSLRPAISKSSDDIIAMISLALPYIAVADPAELPPLPLPEGHEADIAAGLLHIQYSDDVNANRFAAAMDQQAIRVGTTGDYAPFSTGEPGHRSGIDIDLARSLAAYLGLGLVFIETSWPTLLDDLENQSYDIAMSGISIKPFRQKMGHMSAPYQTGGKTPIIRCSDKGTLNSLEAIDEPGVRVIVNPGGTNERHTRAHIKDASIRIFDDNEKIFEEIVAHRADAMITDAIEVAYQSARRPSLCPALPGQTLTTSQKGFLMPKDDVLLLHVNRWLQGITEDGTLQAIFDAHLKLPLQLDP